MTTGEIYLLKNVPLRVDYEHTIDFKNADEQLKYFKGFVQTFRTDCTFIRRDRQYVVVDVPFNDLDEINYVFFRSEKDGRLYYAFVTDKVFVNPVTTNVFYKIDVFQTYMFDWRWKPSYIRQAHVDRWTPDHKPIYSMTEEGLAYGDEYSVESAYKIEQSSSLRWLLVTFSDIEALTGENWGTSNWKSTPTSFVTALVPLKLGLHTQVIVDGEIGQIANYNDLVYAMMFSPAGNYIKSISLMSYNPLIETETIEGDAINLKFFSEISLRAHAIKFSYKITDTTETKTYTSSLPFLFVENVPKGLFEAGRALARTNWDTGVEGSMPTERQWDEIAARPRRTRRDKRFESKLLTYPYRYNILTDWRSAPVVFKNEYLTTDKIEVRYSFAMSPNAPFRFWIKNYKSDPEGKLTQLSQRVSPEFPIVSDAFYTYMLENKNTIQTANENRWINLAFSGASGAVGGAAMGGAAGAIAGGGLATVNGLVSTATQMRSENAKQTDLQAVPNSVTNMTDSSMTINDKTDVVNFYRMRICCEAEEILAQIFAMSGYKVNKVQIPNTKSRVRFNYIQTLGANIEGSFNQNDMQELREIFDKGVTIWHWSAADFNYLNYDYENIEVNLV